MVRKEFPRCTPESVGISSAAISRFLDRLESGFTEMHGLMIMRRGRVCAEGWWAPYAPGLRHGLQSHTKTYAATAVGIAVTEGKVSLDERVIDIFPEFAPENPSENLKKLTVHNVLSMGCGMEEMPRPTENWIRDFLATPVVHEPGTAYMYNSTGSTLLAAIVKKKTGEDMMEYLKPRLFDKIGIDADNLKMGRMPDGTPVGGGGMLATTEDNLRLMKLYADGGVWEGERILSADYVKRATTNQNDSATEAINNPPALDNFVGYGYQIWMCRPKGVYRADGAMGQFTIVDPSRDLIIAINETATGAHWAQETLNVCWEFLEEIDPETAMMPENPALSEALARRMKMLAIPASPYAPFGSFPEGSFAVKSGQVHLENQVLGFMSGEAPGAGLTRFGFSEGEDGCVTLAAEIDGKPYSLSVAVDGRRALNRLSAGLVSQVYLSGCWKEADTFAVRARWIETCFEKEICFQFIGDRCVVTEEEVVGGFLNRPVTPAEAVKQ